MATGPLLRLDIVYDDAPHGQDSPLRPPERPVCLGTEVALHNITASALGAPPEAAVIRPVVGVKPFVADRPRRRGPDTPLTAVLPAIPLTKTYTVRAAFRHTSPVNRRP